MHEPRNKTEKFQNTGCHKGKKQITKKKASTWLQILQS